MQTSSDLRVCDILYRVCVFVDGQADEAEIFDSDFQSTDDEAQQEEGGGEKAIHEEEKREQRVSALCHICSSV